MLLARNKNRERGKKKSNNGRPSTKSSYSNAGKGKSSGGRKKKKTEKIEAAVGKDIQWSPKK